LSRTLLTSSTTILAILLMYIWGGEGIHGFAFCLLIGIVVGTYSSIFVASPVLLWLERRDQAARLAAKVS
jgi:SecD/SecF fusion protein